MTAAASVFEAYQQTMDGVACERATTCAIVTIGESGYLRIFDHLHYQAVNSSRLAEVRVRQFTDQVTAAQLVDGDSGWLPLTGSSMQYGAYEFRFFAEIAAVYVVEVRVGDTLVADSPIFLQAVYPPCPLHQVHTSDGCTCAASYTNFAMRCVHIQSLALIVTATVVALLLLLGKGWLRLSADRSWLLDPRELTIIDKKPRLTYAEYRNMDVALLFLAETQAPGACSGKTSSISAPQHGMALFADGRWEQQPTNILDDIVYESKQSLRFRVLKGKAICFSHLPLHARVKAMAYVACCFTIYTPMPLEAWRDCETSLWPVDRPMI